MRSIYVYTLKCSLYIFLFGCQDMILNLVAPGLDLSIEIFISDQVEKALALQWERLKFRSVLDAFCRRMAQQLDSVILESIDWDIKEPTPAQVSYAMGLSKQLDVAIPPEALRYRGHMHEFLEKHSGLAKAKRQTRSQDRP